MKKSLFIILMFCVASSLCVFQLAAQNATRVYVAEVKKQSVTPTIELSGTVEYPEVSEVASEISGIVSEVLFDEGDRVNKGDVLLRLNSDLLAKETETLEAMYNEANEDTKLKLWEHHRYDTLHMAGDVPLREKKIAETKYNISRHKAAGLKAEWERSKIMLEKKTLRTPFSGVIVKKLTHTGNWLEPGSPAAVIASDGMIDIVCHVPQNKLHLITPGDRAEISANGKTFEGKVFSKIPYGDVNSRTYPVTIRTKNAYSLANGMETHVVLHSGHSRESFLVPRDAIVTKNDSYYIYATKNNRAKEIPVEIVSYKGAKVEIKTDQINGNSQVITRGNRFLTDNQMIEIVR
jgi:RND family efflux transporter MFP subunit